MATATTVTGPADLRDQAWLDDRVAALGDGIEAARDIWQNWTEGRCVGRLAPGQSPGQYIASRGLRLTLAEAMAALPDGSTREVAKVAGVSDFTARAARNLAPDTAPARVRGGDGKTYPTRRAARVIEQKESPTVVDPVVAQEPSPLWDELVAVMSAITALSDHPRAACAQAVPVRRRQTTAKRLRALGVYLGGVAVELESMKEPTE